MSPPLNDHGCGLPYREGCQAPYAEEDCDVHIYQSILLNNVDVPKVEYMYIICMCNGISAGQ